jgi:DNA-binding transcriptional ArsR family regulator
MVNYETQLDATFTALAHPARRAILRRLGRGETSVKELARPLKMSLPAVSKHLKMLDKGGLISRGKDAQWRPCRLEPEALNQASGWLAEQRKIWESRLDRLENYLHEMQKNQKGSKP